MTRYLLLWCAWFALPAIAAPIDYQDGMTMERYLDALGQIAPAAKEGATHYLTAYQRKCGKPLPLNALRRAVAEGDGDPVLMGMMRASAQQDTAALQTLAASLSCSRGS